MSSHRRMQFRDRVAHRLANACLRIASPWYRDMIGGAIQYGMRSAARDAIKGRPAPKRWEELRVDVTGSTKDFVR